MKALKGLCMANTKDEWMITEREKKNTETAWTNGPQYYLGQLAKMNERPCECKSLSMAGTC